MATIDIRTELKLILKYTGRKCGDIELDGVPGLKYFDAAKLILHEWGPEHRAFGLWAFARCLKEHESVAHPLKPETQTDTIQLILEAVDLDPTFAYGFYSLGAFLPKHYTHAKLMNGRVLALKDIYLEALRFNCELAPAYNNLAVCMQSDEETVTLNDGRTVCRHQLYLEALKLLPSYQLALSNLHTVLQRTHTWHHSHAIVHFGLPTNNLFATFLLGLQRLEETGVLPMAHHSMIEDMLELWQWGDSCDLDPLSDGE